MIQPPPSAEYRHFSAEVRLELHANGQTFDLWSIGPSEIILFEGQDICAGDAEIAVFVDGSEFRWPIRLPNGAVPFSTDVFIVPRGPMKPVETGSGHGAGVL